MPSLQSINDKYPLISVATEKDQSQIFDIIDKTSIVSGKIQVGFERRPDFFEVLKSQGPKYLVFLMHNEDGRAHGLAVMSFRPMLKDGKVISVAYASDLRTTRELSKAAHLQWRKMYAEVVTNLSEVPEFQNAQTLLTAVWDSNVLAQRALVKKNARLAVQYEPIATYKACSVVGRLIIKKPKLIRHLRADETSVLKSFLCEPKSPHEITWQFDELIRTLRQLGKTTEDFLVHEQNGHIQSLCLPVDKVPGRITKVLALPKNLIWLTRLAKFLFGIEISMGKELKTTYLMFYRCKNPSLRYKHLSQYLHVCQNREKKLAKRDRTQVYVVSLWNETSLSRELWCRGFINSPISAKLYEVRPSEVIETNTMGIEQLEVALL